MDFVNWAQANGHRLHDATTEQLTAWQAEWRAGNNGDSGIPYAVSADTPDPFLAECNKLYGKYQGNAPKQAEFLAIADNYSNGGYKNKSDANQALLRANLYTGPISFPRGDSSSGAGILEAGLLSTLGMPTDRIAEHYGPRVADITTSQKLRGISAHGIMREVLRANGRHAPTGSFSDESLREVFEVSNDIRASSGTSTYSLSGIFSNVSNKLALESFKATTATWSKFCKQRPAADFKAMKAYRLTALDRLVEVPESGQIKHGTLAESEFSNQVATYGRMLSITRKSLINDDLGLLQTLPAALGRLGQLSLERAVYTLILANTGSFFHTNNANSLTGGGSALAAAGLDDAMEAFEEQKDSNNDPTLVAPKLLLVPSPLHATARGLMNSTAVVGSSTANAPVPDANVWAGMLEVISSPYLGVTLGLSGGSDTAWYVLAGPGDFSIIEVAFLNGINVPTVQQAELDFNVLGIQMRCIFDFGVAFLEPKGGVKSAGT